MANVKLSATELEMVIHPHFILTKNNIIAKVYNLFGELATEYANVLAGNQSLPPEILNTSPKISKGENYEGLPWVMLDYPRSFSTTDVFAIRTFFWWGNFCSVTLQLKGKYLQMLKKENLQKLQPHWYVCINDNEWQHHFRPDNYQPIHSFTANEINALPFIKLAKKIPLNEWDTIQFFCKDAFQQLLSCF